MQKNVIEPIPAIFFAFKIKIWRVLKFDANKPSHAHFFKYQRLWYFNNMEYYKVYSRQTTEIARFLIQNIIYFEQF